ncbi:uncharacterized protein LOC111808716 [Cucurbita pepo subsp. pepo]|uniref:uncharacterized protein LOC111808716 n=1 Tax=Cucurbita pepo subsp. pepo TaxID=3664 RepID=UPI000C9D395E|nr:uncharacterized protein LOC111808716 [Cucurbita pepo subsp. pepo]
MNGRKTHRKLPSKSTPVKIMMQGAFFGREKRMWVAGVPFSIEKSEKPARIFEEVWPRLQPKGGDPRVVRERCQSRWRSVGELCGHRGGRFGASVPFRSFGVFCEFLLYLYFIPFFLENWIVTTTMYTCSISNVLVLGHLVGQDFSFQDHELVFHVLGQIFDGVDDKRFSQPKETKIYRQHISRIDGYPICPTLLNPHQSTAIPITGK